MQWLWLAVAILAEVIATSALKSSNGFRRLWQSVVVVCCYSLALYLLSRTLDVLPVGVVYAIWSGAGWPSSRWPGGCSSSRCSTARHSSESQ